MATSSDKVDFSRLRYEIRKHWWWFIASFAAMMAIAAVYMLKNNPEFKFHADIMIEQGDGGSAVAQPALRDNQQVGIAV